MAFRVQSGKDIPPERGVVARRQRLERGNGIVTDPDGCDHQFAAELSPGQKEMTRLRPRECHGQRGLDRPPIGAGFAVNPGRRVDGDDGNGACRDIGQD